MTAKHTDSAVLPEYAYSTFVKEDYCGCLLCSAWRQKEQEITAMQREVDAIRARYKPGEHALSIEEYTAKRDRCEAEMSELWDRIRRLKAEREKAELVARMAHSEWSKSGRKRWQNDNSGTDLRRVFGGDA